MVVPNNGSKAEPQAQDLLNGTVLSDPAAVKGSVQHYYGQVRAR